MDGATKLTTSLEDYLKTIFQVVSKKHAAKARDITDLMGVKGSSVTGALKSLKDKGMINYQPYDIITLTPVGEKTARELLQRREILQKFLAAVLDLDAEEAENAAGKLKGKVDEKIMNRLIHYLKFISSHPQFKLVWRGERGFELDKGRRVDEL